MALNTKQYRGSAIHVSMPWRNWLAEPTGTASYATRISILRYCSATVPLDIPGVEYLWTGDRLHYLWNGTRSHYVWTGDRLHYHGDEELR